jgi:hypothetical protein
MTDNNSDTKTCPYCAEVIKAAATICRYCFRELPQNDYLLKKDLLIGIFNKKLLNIQAKMNQRKILWNGEFDRMKTAESVDRLITGILAPIGRVFMGKRKLTEDMRKEWVNFHFENDQNVKVYKFMMEIETETKKKIENDEYSLAEIERMISVYSNE